MDSARTLSENLASLLRHEHDALAEFLVALAVFDERRLWAELGYSSLFYYLHRELRLSKREALGSSPPSSRTPRLRPVRSSPLPGRLRRGMPRPRRC
jgi:hypothetical protein